MGFKHKITKRKKYVAKETMDLVSKRFRCLRALRDARAADRSLVYTDETWFTTRMTHGSEWIDTTKDEKDDIYSRQVPPGEGQLLITIAAGGKDGFLQESVVNFAARNAGGDYHGEVNLELYVEWLEKNLLPHLDVPSSIIIDNAPYHSALTAESRCPMTRSTKAEITQWLTARDILFSPSGTRPELLELVRHKPRPSFVFDELIQSYGHDVIRLSPGHPELNAIEMTWDKMKHKCALL